MNRRLMAVVSLTGGATVTAAVLLVLFAHGFRPFGPAEKLAQVGADAIWITAGLVAWNRRPDNRVGALMTAVGFTDVVHQLYWNAALPFTIAQVWSFSSLPVTLHLFMAFPSGKVDGGLERRFVASAYTLVVVLSPLSALFWDWQGTDCRGCPANLLLVWPGSPLWPAVSGLGDIVLLGLFGTGIVLVIRRLRRATAAVRRAMLPVLVTAAVAAAALCLVIVLDAGGQHTEGGVPLWISDVLYAAIPLAFLFGLLQMRWRRAAVADLVVDLRSSADPDHARESIARAVHDPSMELAFWLPTQERFVDVRGEAIAVAETPARAVTVLDHEGKRIAALLHDPSLRSDPRLLEAVAAAASMALENLHLQTELRAQLSEVRASRGRIVAAGDAERRRLERNLHDGAQQRLLGIRLALQLARGRLPDGGSDASMLLSEADTEVVAALEDLRALARGIHPMILAEEGLVPALGALARRTPVPVQLHASVGRLAPPVEATSYFVVAEALANVVKHAHAAHVTIDVARHNGYLAVDIVDDGCGGADPSGEGLTGLRDRVEVHNGRLVVDSPPGSGTRVSAVIPCA